MNSINDRIKDSERWREAEENLRSFDEMMKLVNQYPIKILESVSSEPQYVPSNLLLFL